MKRKIIIDCDPGHDDMMAIILALANPNKLDVLGITTVAGNQTGDKTFRNALRVLSLIDRTDIPVARGFDKPLFRTLVTAPEIHGVSGLDGTALPEPKSQGLKKHASDFIVETIANSKGKVTLVPTGPLTNVAAALMKAPYIREKLERIVLMGGAVFDSNITPAAEFNIFVDPEAAKVVFESGVPITMVGLDVTNRALLSFEDIEMLRKKNRKVSKILAPLLNFFANTNKSMFGFEGAPLHDALAVAYLIDRRVLKTELFHVDIETKGEFTSGRTVVDIYGVTQKKPNAEVALQLNLPMFKKLMLEAISFFDDERN